MSKSRQPVNAQVLRMPLVEACGNLRLVSMVRLESILPSALKTAIIASLVPTLPQLYDGVNGFPFFFLP